MGLVRSIFETDQHFPAFLILFLQLEIYQRIREKKKACAHEFILVRSICKKRKRKMSPTKEEKGDPQFAAKIKGIHRVKNNYHDNDQGLYGFTKREMEGSVLRCALSFIRVAPQISTVSQCLFIKATPPPFHRRKVERTSDIIVDEIFIRGKFVTIGLQGN